MVVAAKIDLLAAAGPIVGVVLYGERPVTYWRHCVLCGASSKKFPFIRRVAEECTTAAAAALNWQWKHLREFHPELLEQSVEESAPEEKPPVC